MRNNMVSCTDSFNHFLSGSIELRTVDVRWSTLPTVGTKKFSKIEQPKHSKLRTIRAIGVSRTYEHQTVDSERLVRTWPKSVWWTLFQSKRVLVVTLWSLIQAWVSSTRSCTTRIPAYVNKIGGILNGFYRMIFNLIELDILPKNDRKWNFHLIIIWRSILISCSLSFLWLDHAPKL